MLVQELRCTRDPFACWEEYFDAGDFTTHELVLVLQSLRGQRMQKAIGLRYIIKNTRGRTEGEKRSNGPSFFQRNDKISVERSISFLSCPNKLFL